jgi:hypothetical protein
VGSIVTISVLGEGVGRGARLVIDLADGSNDHLMFAAQVGGEQGKGLHDDSGRTLTLFVVADMLAGQFYSFTFTLKNPLCEQPAQPVCIRARNMQVGCKVGAVIPGRLMTPDTTTVLSGIHSAAAGDAAPLKIYKPNILTLTMLHSTPWPSAINTLTVAMQLNVPLLHDAFAPRITISNLVGTLTTSVPAITIAAQGSATTPITGATFDAALGALSFQPPYDTDAGTTYTITFKLQNRKCEHTAPVTRMSITSEVPAGQPGICFDQKDVTRLTLTACSTATEPLAVLGGPCGVGSASAASFTLKTISQSTPQPGCENTITLGIKTSIPLSYTEQAAIVIDFADSLEIGAADGEIGLGGADADKNRFYGSAPATNTAKGVWTRDTKTLTLNVASAGVLACQEYSVTITVVNPLQVPSPAAGSVLQEAQAVTIRALGTVDGTAGRVVVIQPTPMVLGNGDAAPMRVHKPTFVQKTVVHSSPYPGAPNTIKVSFSTNTNLGPGSLIAIHNVEGAIAASGDMALAGENDVTNRFESLAGTTAKGTWHDCQKALILKVQTALECTGAVYVVSFDVQNPIQPQLCAEVMINATGISKDSNVFGDALTSITNDNGERVPAVWNGVKMQADKSNPPAYIYGALGEDACPMTVWPAAFLVKDIGQGTAHPCALNTITVTISTNVPLYPVVQYPGRAAAIMTDIILSRVKRATQDSGTTSIALQTQQVDPSNAPASNTDLFTDLAGVVNKASWSVNAYEATITLRRRKGGADCCVPGPSGNVYTFSFNVYNPALPQDPTNPVSISATGIPIQVSAMRHDINKLRPMYVKAAVLVTKRIQQSSAFPCASNTISVVLKLDVNLYTRCNTVITLTSGGHAEYRGGDVVNLRQCWRGHVEQRELVFDGGRTTALARNNVCPRDCRRHRNRNNVVQLRHDEPDRSCDTDRFPLCCNRADRACIHRADIRSRRDKKTRHSDPAKVHDRRDLPEQPISGSAQYHHRRRPKQCASPGFLQRSHHDLEPGGHLR